MKFEMIHNNINVADAEVSKRFYMEALNFREVRRKETEDFVLIYLEDGNGKHQLELTQLYGHPQKYDLGENEIHLAVSTDNFQEALEHHKKMGCVCFENKGMGIYFIEDPDGYWTEILPQR